MPATYHASEMICRHESGNDFASAFDCPVSSSTLFRTIAGPLTLVFAVTAASGKLWWAAPLIMA